jgi:hypothetical protein
MATSDGIRIEIDHLIVVVQNLGEAADQLLFRHGLDSVSGGRHPGHGTANRIVPLGTNYIELLAVADEDEAQGSEFGRWALQERDPDLKVSALCLRTNDLDAVCRDLQLESTEMSRARPDGSELHWRIAGLEAALGAERLPFFIQWMDETDLPSRVGVNHQAEVEGITAVSISGDESKLRRMTHGAESVEIIQGAPGILSATVGKPTGDLVLSGVES